MKNLLLLVCFLCVTVFVIAQTPAPAFRKEVDALEKKDSIEMPGPNKILFTGSSSFTKWTDVQEYYPGYPILNRAFGGSTLVDLIRYVDEVITPYNPKQIVMYCGENDIAASDTVTPQMVLQRFQQLLTLIRKKLPKVPIAFVSLKPSVSRWKLEPKYVEANRLIQNFIGRQKNITFINVHDAMLNADGSVMTDIFVADNLHMNAKGYKIWQPIIKPFLTVN